MNGWNMNRLGKAMWILIVLGFFFLSLFIFFAQSQQASTMPSIPSIPNNGEVKYYGYKYANFSNIIVSALHSVSCAWKPDDIDDGWKTCEIVFEIENQRNIKPVISLPSLNSSFFNTTIRNSTLNFSNTFTFFNYTYLNISDNETASAEEIIQFTRRRFSNFTALPASINTANPFAIRLTFEAPKYQANFFNFSVNTAGFSAFLDPDVSACGSLGTADSTYTLTQDVSTSGTCFTITANNITLVGNGFSVLYGSVSGSYGVQVAGANDSVITGMYINATNNTGNNKYGIYFLNAKNGTARNNSLNNTGATNPDAIRITTSSNVTISKNQIWTGNTGILGSRGIFVTGSDNVTIMLNNITTTGFGAHGVVTDSLNTTMYYNNITAYGSSAIGIFSSAGSDANISRNIIFINSTGDGITMDGTNNTFRNNRITTIGAGAEGITIRSTSGTNLFFDTFVNASSIGTNDTQFTKETQGTYNFTNVTLANNNLFIANATSNATVNFHWYVDVNVKETRGNNIHNANVTAWNVSGAVIFSNLTNSAGNTARQIVLSYWRNSSFIAEQNNYTIQAHNGSYYFANNRSINLTFSNNTQVNFILEPGVNITACETLNVSNTLYYLILNVSNDGGCMVITAQNITLDGNLNSITFGTSLPVMGINVSARANNFTLQNAKILETASANTVVYMDIANGMNIVLKNTNLTTTGSDSDNDPILYFSGGNATAWIYDSFIGADSSSGSDYEIIFTNNGSNATFINTTFRNSNFAFNGSNSFFHYAWWLEANASYTNGSLASGVNISAIDRNGTILFSNLTNATGLIERQFLAEYRRNITATLYRSNYTFNATSPFGTNLASSWNMTTNRNLVFTFNLSTLINLSQRVSASTLQNQKSDFTRGNIFSLFARNIAGEFGVFLRGINQKLIFSQISSRFFSGIKVSAQSLNLDETLVRILGAFRVPSQPLNLDEILVKFVTIPRSLSQPLNLDETAIRIVGALRLPFQSLNLDEAAARILGSLRLSIQSLNLDETLVRILGALRTPFQSLNLDETFVRFITIPRALINALNLDETFVRFITIPRTLAQSLDLTDLVSRIFSGFRISAQSLTLTPLTSKTLFAFRIFPQPLNLDETFTRFVFLPRTLTQSLHLDALPGRTTFFFRNIFDFFRIFFRIPGFGGGEVPSAPASGGGGVGGGGGAAPLKKIKSFYIDKKEITLALKPDQTRRTFFKIYNNGTEKLEFDVQLSSLKSFITINNKKFLLGPGESSEVELIVTAPEKSGVYASAIILKAGGIQKEIPIVIHVETAEKLFDVVLEVPEKYKEILAGSLITVKTEIFNLKDTGAVDVVLTYVFKDLSDHVIFEESDTVAVDTRTALLKDLRIPSSVQPGKYVLAAEARYQGTVTSASALIAVVEERKSRLTGMVIDSLEENALTVFIGIIIVSVFLLSYLIYRRRAYRILLKVKMKERYSARKKWARRQLKKEF